MGWVEGGGGEWGLLAGVRLTIIISLEKGGALNFGKRYGVVGVDVRVLASERLAIGNNVWKRGRGGRIRGMLTCLTHSDSF